MTTTTPQGPIRTPRGFGIDPRLGAAILRAPAFSREDSHRQAIFKFHHHSSLDYRACHGLPIMAFGNLSLKKYIFVYFDIQTQHRGAYFWPSYIVFLSRQQTCMIKIVMNLIVHISSTLKNSIEKVSLTCYSQSK